MNEAQADRPKGLEILWIHEVSLMRAIDIYGEDVLQAFYREYTRYRDAGYPKDFVLEWGEGDSIRVFSPSYMNQLEIALQRLVDSISERDNIPIGFVAET